MASDNVDVLIVGAGPVGLFLANECARRRMAFRIIEDDAAQSAHSKALAIFPRTLEVFDMAGIAEPFLQAGNRVTKLAITTHDRTLGRIEFHPGGTPYQFIAMVPQDVSERILVEQLRNGGNAVEYETTFVSLRQNASRVEATVQCRGEEKTIEASYVVGCDGAHSAVRHALGLAFEGAEYADTYLLADATTNTALAPNELQLCPSELGPCALFPMSAMRWRLVATTDAIEGDAPSLESVNDLLSKRGPQGFRAESLVWSTYFRIHHRCVAEMSSGRVFVAGDAAHIHSPFGGQGMNTGLQDAWNLAWKLDLAVRGLATDALLPSYTQERHPIVLGVIQTTDFLTNALGARNPIVSGVRDAAIPIATHIPAFKEAFAERLSGLGNAYGGSPIVEGSGKRYFDESLAGGGIKDRFIFMAPNEESGSTAAGRLASRFPQVVELRPASARNARLIRPDGYLAYDGAANSRELGAVEDVLQRQVRAAPAP